MIILAKAGIFASSSIVLAFLGGVTRHQPTPITATSAATAISGRPVLRLKKPAGTVARRALA